MSQKRYSAKKLRYMVGSSPLGVLLTVKGVAEVYGVWPSTVHSAIRDGRLPARKLDGEAGELNGLWVTTYDFCDMIWTRKADKDQDNEPVE